MEAAGRVLLQSHEAAMCLPGQTEKRCNIKIDSSDIGEMVWIQVIGLPCDEFFFRRTRGLVSIDGQTLGRLLDKPDNTMRPPGLPLAAAHLLLSYTDSL